MKVKNRRGVPLKEWLDSELLDSEFKKHYDEAAAKWRVALEIIEARQKANLTQGELAHQIGDRQQNVSRIESGEQNVTVGTLEKIAKAVGGHLIVKIKVVSASKNAKGWVIRDRIPRKRYLARLQTRKSSTAA